MIENNVNSSIYLFVAGFVPNDFWRHPGNGAGKTHLCRVFVPLAGGAEVANLDNFISSNKNTKKRYKSTSK